MEKLVFSAVTRRRPTGSIAAVHDRAGECYRYESRPAPSDPREVGCSRAVGRGGPGVPIGTVYDGANPSDRYETFPIRYNGDERL